MRRFEELPDWEQAELLADALDEVIGANCGSIDELAQKEGCSVQEVWQRICSEAGLSETTLPIELPRRLERRN
jgi:hypothetical protein